MIVALALIPVSAVDAYQVTVSCSDGTDPTEFTVTVDKDTLNAIKEAVEAIALYPAGLTCNLTVGTILTSLFLGVASAADGPQDYALGGASFTQVRGSDCATSTNPTGTVTVHENVNLHKPATASSPISGHIAQRVVAPDSLCHGGQRTAIVGPTGTCFVVSGNQAWAEGLHTKFTSAGAFGGTYAGVDPLHWRGQDNPVKPDNDESTDAGGGQCAAMSMSFANSLQGNIVIVDR